MDYICPFCHKLMICKEYDDRLQYSCKSILCENSPYYLYNFSINKNGNLIHVVVLLEYENWYALSIDFIDNTTMMEQLKMVPNDGSDIYYLPVNIMWIENAIQFDLNNPIESGKTIINRLLNLRVFI